MTIPLCDGVARQVVVWNSVGGCDLPEPGACTYGDTATPGILYASLACADEGEAWQTGGYSCGPVPEGRS